MIKVLFVGEYNDANSLIAEAFFNHYAQHAARACSGGMHLVMRIDPVIIQAMKEKGIDISAKRPRMVAIEMMGIADKVISVDCRDTDSRPSAYIPTEEWPVNNSGGKSIEEVRVIRDEIEARVKKLLEELLQQHKEPQDLN